MPRDHAIAIPAGKILLGSPGEHLDDLACEQHYDREWFEDEEPQNHADVQTFWIDAHLITNAEFLEFTQAVGYVTAAERRGFGLVYGEVYWEEVEGASWRYPGGPGDTIEARMDHPVVHVSYYDAVAFADWVGKRLPTEAEWEYAAHGPEWRCWPWGNTWDPDRANCVEYWSGCSISDPDAWRSWWVEHRKSWGNRPATTPVGCFSPRGDSPFGVTDMAGNVSEWTGSSYSLYDPNRSYLPNYEVAAGRYRVIRGGSWMNFRYQLRTSERFAADPTYSNLSVGFRCASGERPA
ncbi:MAG TPA: SUMF1/EgtB/PvdO family nonheme iron enzyme [Streptosporangiaceae bacterium]|nr:SUMF1/EgtB/PvdO family nonheme iron enzyme [Streptosporangiaceae bacterium]